jgi:hypothetical protein
MGSGRHHQNVGGIFSSKFSLSTLGKTRKAALVQSAGLFVAGRRIQINARRGGVGLVALPQYVESFIVAAKQCQQRGNILLVPDVETDPPGIGKMMMRRSLAAGYKFITDCSRKRQVGDAVTMEMPDFPFADAKFASTEAMRTRRHARPAQEFILNDFTDVIGRCHGLSVWLMDWAGVRTIRRARAN